MENSGWIQYVTVTLVVAGVVAGILFWVRNLLEDVRAKITGIWTNGDNSFRVLIYNIETVLQGDVIWAAPQHQKLLGHSILQNMKLSFFIFGKGIYTCPHTSERYEFRVRFLSKQSLQFYFSDKSGKLISETWKLVA